MNLKTWWRNECRRRWRVAFGTRKTRWKETFWANVKSCNLILGGRDTCQTSFSWTFKIYTLCVCCATMTRCRYQPPWTRSNLYGTISPTYDLVLTSQSSWRPLMISCRPCERGQLCMGLCEDIGRLSFFPGHHPEDQWGKKKVGEDLHWFTIDAVETSITRETKAQGWRPCCLDN